MDKRIRKNEVCIVNLPSCDYVFSSTRSCFVAYGFRRSQLEVEIIQSLLKDRGIELHEAGGALAPGQYAFCTKICSKIITSQFCIVLLNNDVDNGVEKPNANVSMEYGLMLGFNKYVIPFQHLDYNLPFNVSGLDTIKYENSSFKEKAAKAIDRAILDTKQESAQNVGLDHKVGAYLLLRGAILSRIDSEGDRNLFQLGQVCGFNLCVDFEGNSYIFFGNFSNLHPEVIAWRVQKLFEIVAARFRGVSMRREHGIVTVGQEALLMKVAESLQVWVLANSADDQTRLLELLPPELYQRARSLTL